MSQETPQVEPTVPTPAPQTPTTDDTLKTLLNALLMKFDGEPGGVNKPSKLQIVGVWTTAGFLLSKVLR